MKGFQNKSLGFYLALTGSCVMLLATIVYLAYSLSVKLFVPAIFVTMLASALLGAGVAFSGVSPLLIVPTALSMASFGLYLNDRIEMFVLMASGVYGMSETGAILWLVVLILALQLLSFFLLLTACFFLLKKSENDAENAKLAAYRAQKRESKAALLQREKEIVAQSDIPICLRMLSAGSKAKLALVTAALIAVSAVLGGIVGSRMNRGETQPQAAAVETVGLVVTQLPDKLQYNEGEFFNGDGMQVALLSSDGKLKGVEGWYTSADGQAMTLANREVTVSFQDYSTVIKLGVTEAATAGILEGATQKLKFKQNGTVQAALGDGAYQEIGTWKNVGPTVMMNLLGTETTLTCADDTYTASYGGETLMGSLHVLTSLRLGGLSERGEIAGYGIATLNEDGTATVERSSGIMRDGTWYAVGNAFYVDMEGQTYVGEYYDGEYHLVIEASVAGYAFTYTTSESDLPKAEAQIEGARQQMAQATPAPEPEPDETVYLTLTGDGHGASEGRIATLTLHTDGTAHLEWNYAGRYVLGEYTGTWENAGMGQLSVTVNENNDTQTTYPFDMDASTYSEGYITFSFTWAKDKDTDPDYNILLTGTANVQ